MDGASNPSGLPGDFSPNPPHDGGVPFILLGISLIIFVGALFILSYAYDLSTAAGGETQTSTTLAQAGQRPQASTSHGSYGALLEKWDRGGSGKLNYSMTIPSGGMINVTFPMQYAKLGGDSKTVMSVSALGYPSTYAVYQVKGRLITCTENPSNGAVDCSVRESDSQPTYAPPQGLPDVAELKRAEAAYAGRGSAMGRGCSLFDINASTLPNSTRYGYTSYYSYGGRAHSVAYQICLDDELGFPSLVSLKYVSYSRLAGTSSEAPIYSLALAGYDSHVGSGDVLPPEELDFVVVGVGCTEDAVRVNVTLLGGRPDALTINVSESSFGSYDYSTGSYTPPGRTTRGVVTASIPSAEADVYQLEKPIRFGDSTVPTVVVCSARHCETTACYRQVSRYDYEPPMPAEWSKSPKGSSQEAIVSYSKSQWNIKSPAGAFEFSGAGDYAKTGSWTPPAGAFTVCAWANPVATHGSIFQFSIGYGGGQFDRFLYLDNLSKVTFYVWNPNGMLFCPATGKTTIHAGRWYHLCGTVDTKAGNSVWVNGNREATNPSGTDAWEGYGAYALLGARSGGMYRWTEDFEGAMDGVTVWNRTLSADEIKKQYQAGLAAHSG
jgi:hypothetical protein